MPKIPNSASNVPSHHSGAQGWDFAGRKRIGGSGAVATGGGWCSWLRTGLSCPWGAVTNCPIMLARLTGWQCDLALCLWAASGFGGAWLRDSPSSSGVVFLLVGVPALCPVHLSVPVHWRSGQRGGSGDHHDRIWRRRRRHWRRSLGRLLLRSQRRGCVAAR